MRDTYLGIASLATIAIFIISIAMMFGTKYYLNNSKRRKRFIELIWGTDNEWYNGKKFDVVMANIFVANAPLIAWRMKIGWITKKQMQLGAYAYPALHKNLNYLLLLEEFKFFVRWEAIKAMLLLVGILSMTIIYGLAEGWW
jgi:hypothetical protein